MLASTENCNFPFPLEKGRQKEPNSQEEYPIIVSLFLTRLHLASVCTSVMHTTYTFVNVTRILPYHPKLIHKWTVEDKHVEILTHFDLLPSILFT